MAKRRKRTTSRSLSTGRKKTARIRTSKSSSHSKTTSRSAPVSRSRKNKKRKHWRRLTRRGLLLLIVVIGIVVCMTGREGYEYVSHHIKEDIQYPRPYQELVQTYAKEYEVPQSVVYGVMRTESNFKEKAKSQVGACGLMQLMPDTFTWLQGKLGENLDDQEIFDPETNIQYGTYYLSWLHEIYPDWETVYAAYNAGPKSVNAWLEKYDEDQDGVLSTIPYAETAGYVEKVGSAREQYQEIYHMS